MWSLFQSWYNLVAYAHKVSLIYHTKNVITAYVAFNIGCLSMWGHSHYSHQERDHYLYHTLPWLGNSSIQISWSFQKTTRFIIHTIFYNISKKIYNHKNEYATMYLIFLKTVIVNLTNMFTLDHPWSPLIFIKI